MQNVFSKDSSKDQCWYWERNCEMHKSNITRCFKDVIMRSSDSTATQQHKNAWRNKRTKSTCPIASGWRHRSKKVVWSSKPFLEALGAHAAVHENFSCKRVVVGSAWTPFASLLCPLATPRRREKKCVMRKRGQTVLSCWCGVSAIFYTRAPCGHQCDKEVRDSMLTNHNIRKDTLTHCCS